MQRVVVCSLAVAVALAAGGCRSLRQRLEQWGQGTGTSPAAKTPATQSLARTLTGPFNERASTDAAVGALAQSGVEVYDDKSFALVRQPSGRKALLRYTRFQARNMALETSTGGGLLGAQLDAVTPAITFKGTKVPVTPSGLVAAWAVAGVSPGADLARRLLGTIDARASKRIRFPTLVLALFLADAAPAPTKSATGSLGERLDSALATADHLLGAPKPAWAAGGPCATARELLQQLDGLLASLQNSPDTGLLGFIAGALARLGVQVALEAVRAQVASLRSMLGTVAAAVYSASLLNEWSLDVKAQPPSLHYAPGRPAQGRFVATVVGSDGIDYPDWVKECAALFNLALPNTQQPDGMAIKWFPGAGFNAHAHPAPGADETVQAGGLARYPIATSQEDPQTHGTGAEDRRPAEIAATVKRTIDPQQLARFVSGVTGLPSAVTGGIAGQAGDRVSFVDVTGRGSATVGFHVSPASFRKVIQGGGATIIVEGHNCAGLYGTWTVKIDINPGGEQVVTFAVTKDNPTGSFGWSIPIPHGVHSGEMSATVSDTQVSFSGGNRVATPYGAAGRSDAGSAPITRGPTAKCTTRASK
jgi:hypothetical protein